MTFSIDEIYKRGVPRGEMYRSPETTLSSSTTTPLTVSAETNPSWTYFIERIRLYDASLTTSGTGSGVLKVQYPEYTGTTTKTTTFNTLKMHADVVVTASSATYYDVVLKPPVMIGGSSTVSAMTVGLPANVAIASGTLTLAAIGWRIKTADYE